VPLSPCARHGLNAGAHPGQHASDVPIL
jgi:hypothetical protein